MDATNDGLRAIRAVISCPAQWRLLLALADGPQSLSTLWYQLPRHDRWHGPRALIGLWRNHLIVFHVKQRTWALSTKGAGLRPVLAAILTCTQTRTQPTGGPTK